MAIMLHEYREKYREGLFSGERMICPVCDRAGKIYRRPIDSGQVRALALLAQHDDAAPGSYVHLATFLNERKANRGNVAVLLRHWHLIESQSNPNPFNTDPHGMYRITQLGNDFLDGIADIPKYIYTYDEELWGWSDADNPIGEPENWIFIHEVRNFDLAEIFS